MQSGFTASEIVKQYNLSVFWTFPGLFQNEILNPGIKIKSVPLHFSQQRIYPLHNSLLFAFRRIPKVPVTVNP
jgi:hypothetical protein